MKKRLTSSLLILCLLLSLLPVNILAVDGSARIPYAVEGGNIYFNANTGEIVGADNTITAANIPAQIGGVAVTGIMANAFGDDISAGLACQRLQRVTLPEGLTTIGNEAFAKCIALEEINIPSTVTSIGELAFLDCAALREITLPEGLTTLESGVFTRCTSLKTISIPGSVGTVRYVLLSGCTALEEVWIGEGITSIENNAFDQNDSLRTIHIPHSVKKVLGLRYSPMLKSLSDIYYDGTALEWEDLMDSIGQGYAKLLAPVTVHYKNSSTTTPTEPGESLEILPIPVAEHYTVTFDPNASNVVHCPAPQTVLEKKSAEKPEDPSRPGYIFAGWYDNRACTGTPYFDADGNSAVLTKSLTLYAKWKNPVGLTENDIFAFTNSQSDYFDVVENRSSKYYPMEDSYRELAVDIYSGNYLKVNPGTKDNPDEVAKQKVNSFMQTQSWNGACFGASTIIAQGIAGFFSPLDVQKGAATIKQLTAPKDDKELRSLLHLYHFIQYMPEILNIIKLQNAISNTEWGDLVYALQTSDTPVLVGFYWKKHTLDPYGKDTGETESAGGHVVLAYDCVFIPEEPGTPAHYEIKIWDSRDTAKDNIKSPRILSLYFDKSSVTGIQGATADFSREYDDYPSFSELACYMTIEDLTHWNVPELLKARENTETSASTNSNQGGASNNDLSLPPFLHTNYSAFAIACSDGTRAVIENGEKISGTLDISGGIDFGIPVDVEDYCPTYTFTLPNQGANASYTITPVAKKSTGPETVQYQTVLSCNTTDGYFSSTSASAPGTITITGTGTTTTSFPSAVEQEVTVVRNGAGTPWFNNTVSAVSASLTADPLSDGTVRFTSRDSAKLTLSVSDFDTEIVFDPVTPDASGIRIAQQGTNTATILDSKGGVLASKSITSTETPDIPNTPGNTLPFTDVQPGQWFYDAVAFVHQKGLMAGVAADTFAPDDTTTRGMIVTILHRLEGNPAAVSAGFSDVPNNQWYAAAVNWAAENNVASGYGDGRFGPNDPITREQLVAMLWRYSGSPAASGDFTGFTDTNQISDYATEAMRWAVTNGIINGSNGQIDPKGWATRAQVAQLLKNFIENN